MPVLYLVFLFALLSQGSGLALKTFKGPVISRRNLAGTRILAMGIISGNEAKKALQEKYDYIIVGGGTAGCVLANRLSAYPDKRILLVEAGTSNFNGKYMKIPAGIVRLFKTAFDWNFETENEKFAKDRNIYLCRGKVLGGSSSLNVLLYHRGAPVDFEQWATVSSSDEWGPKKVLPYFKKSQDDFRGESRYHGTGGEYSVSEVRYQNVLSKTFLNACDQLELIENKDFNDWSRSQEGFGRFQVTQKNGARCSTATGFLQPALKRKNLTVIANGLVKKIVFDQMTATGIEIDYNGEGLNASLSSGGEIILSGGAINSPQILMLSGIGPKSHLESKGIDTIVDLPGVGQNLQDHPAAVVSYSVKDGFDRISPTSKMRIPGTTIMNPKILLQWLLFKTGILTSVGCDHGGFFKTQSSLKAPDLQMRFLAAKALSPDGMSTYSKFRSTPGNNDGFSFQSIAARPHSTGSVELRSNNPLDSPAIRTGYFTDERDIVTIREGLKLSRKIAQAPAFAPFIGEEVYPGVNITSDDDLDDYIRSNVHTSNALVGTCSMGTDANSVVGADLKVHGVQNLRVADASIMPKIIGGQTGAPTVMIAEKAADFILGH